MIGVDIVEIEQIRLSSSFVSYILTAEEQEEYNALPAEKQKKEYQKQVENAKEISEFYSKEHVYKMWKEFYTEIAKKKKKEKKKRKKSE